MQRGIVNYGVNFLIAFMVIVSFFLIRELGFYLYTENIKPIQYISRQRDLYYSIYLSSFYVAMPLLLFLNILNVKLKWHFTAAFLYALFILSSYIIHHPMWAYLLIMSYWGAFFFSLFLNRVMKRFTSKMIAKNSCDNPLKSSSNQ